MTTPNVNKSLSEIFDINLVDTDKSIDELKIAAKAESIDSLEKQREYVKANIIALIEKGTKALNRVIEIAESTEVAKDFNAVTDLLKTLVDTNMTLLECEVVHKNKNEPVQSLANDKVTNNTVFVGSTQELAAFLNKPSVSVYQNNIENK